MLVRYNDFNRLFDWPFVDRRPAVTNGENGLALRRPATNVYDGEDGYVVEGVLVGENIVTSGTFLVDSQATLENPQGMKLLSEGLHTFHPPANPEAYLDTSHEGH